jgi:sugar lactone lactonase YvrE
VVRFPGWAGAAPSGFAISPDGRRGYAARSSARDIVVVDTDPTSATFHTIVAAIPLAAMPFDVAFAPARPSGPAGSAARWGGSD